MSHHQHVISESAAFRLLNGLVATGSATPLAVQPPTAPPAEVSCSPEISPPTGQLPGGTPTASMAALEISSARQRMLPPITRRSSQESVHSANENGNSCRICRWNRSDMEIIKCPCSCKGSVVTFAGFHPSEVPKALDYAQAG
ncbi:uncharacterized protein LOC108040104 isoform X2 [Drosophila rhopaloa]|uniref:Uncharacterized protein LOC108040104 isoform X2 n=1 Tax=Drosophila rhopaloa TaxID=1041015 RepID=A0A6P4E8H6_DRORH|nr:uncharacterized protein LOC108040104 isoform X2 [Drosophila rhopaloa]